MILPTDEAQAVKLVKETIPDYLLGECINAARELPPMTTVIVRLESDGHIGTFYDKEEKKVIHKILEGYSDVSFDLDRTLVGGGYTIDGRMRQIDGDFKIVVGSYLPRVEFANH